jgi:hypothetical protein
MSYKLHNENNVLSVVSEQDSKTSDVSAKPYKKAIEMISDRTIGNIEKVAIRSTKNVYLEGFGKISKGINIISKRDSDYWLTKKYCTSVTPDEVAREYGVK